MTLEQLQDYGLHRADRPSHRYWYVVPFATPYIMAVASIDLMYDLTGGLWAAYIDAVPGERHDEEWQAVADSGGKLTEAQARAWFPQIPAELKWRD